MTKLEFLELFIAAGAFKKGHFVYSNGRHGLVYINMEVFFDDSEAMSRLCRPIAERFAESSADSITGPARGGLIVASRVRDHLLNIRSRGINLISVFKTSAGDFFSRPSDRNQIFNQRVLVVEDVINTGESVRKVINLVQALGGNVVGVGALYNRGRDISGNVFGDGIRTPDFFALLNKPEPSWNESGCPLCKDMVPVNPNFGRGREFLEKKRMIRCR
jgi:orotate phosphoribosyltransferase